MAVGFVILNYNTYDLTLKCVTRCLEVSSTADCVIIDNNSLDGERLSIHYKDAENVDVVLSTENLGFSKGNNLGIDFLRRNYSPDFVVVCNADTYIESSDFEQRLEYDLASSSFSVLAPDIKNPETQLHQNPMFGDRGISTSIIRNFIIGIFVRFLRLGLQKIFPKLITKILSAHRQRDALAEKDGFIQHPLVGIIPHGSFLVFSENFFHEYDGFYPGIYMYTEEFFLAWMCKISELKILYDPSIKVQHLEGKALSASMSDFDGEIFKTKNMLKSALKLLKYCKENPINAR